MRGQSPPALKAVSNQKGCFRYRILTLGDASGILISAGISGTGRYLKCPRIPKVSGDKNC